MSVGVNVMLSLMMQAFLPSVSLFYPSLFPFSVKQLYMYIYFGSGGDNLYSSNSNTRTWKDFSNFLTVNNVNNPYPLPLFYPFIYIPCSCFPSLLKNRRKRLEVGGEFNRPPPLPPPFNKKRHCVKPMSCKCTEYLFVCRLFSL